MILSAVVGSHAYGLATAASDTDRRGVAKRTGEHRALDTTDVADASRLTADVERLHERLTAAQAATSLPEYPAVDDQMDDLVVRARLG